MAWNAKPEMALNWNCNIKPDNRNRTSKKVWMHSLIAVKIFGQSKTLEQNSVNSLI